MDFITLNIGIVAFLLLSFIYFTSLINIGGENKNEHVFLRLFLVFVFMSLLLLIANGTRSNKNYCDFVVNNQTVANATTSYTYRYECIENTANTANTFYWAILWLNRIFWGYIFVYATYKALKYWPWLNKGKYKKNERNR
jgi:uncharacterized protein with PQ loop repeat